MSTPGSSRRRFLRMTATATTAAVGLTMAPGLASAAGDRQPGADPGAAGFDPYNGEPLNAGPNCDRGFGL